uniref:Metallothionein 1 n=1 Tax=Mus musculus TaxID=10090 RepID=A0A1D5RMG1_MOUSE
MDPNCSCSTGKTPDPWSLEYQVGTAERNPRVVEAWRE